MNVSINGEERSIDTDSRVIDLLELLSIPRTLVAVELNEELLPKSQYDERVLREGDRLEIVTLVGGG